MQAGAQILMEQKNRGRTVLCAASHCFHTLLKLPLPGQFLFLLLFFYLFFPRRLEGDFDVRLAKFWRRRRINWAWKVSFVKKRAENEKLQQDSEHKNQLRHCRNMQTTWWKHKIKE